MSRTGRIFIIALFSILSISQLAGDTPFDVWGDGWEMVDTTGKRLPPAFLFLPYNSLSAPYFYRGNLDLGTFSSLNLEIYSSRSTQLEIAIFDESGKIYRAVRTLAGDAITQLRLRPENFESDPAETYIKQGGSGKSFAGMVRLFDTGTADALLPRTNRLVVHGVEIEHPPLPAYEGLMRIRNEFRLRSSWEVRGDIILEPGARLVIEGCSLRLDGRIISFGGEILLENGEIFFMSNSRGDAGIELSDGSRLTAHDFEFRSVYPIRLEASGASEIIYSRSQFVGDARVLLREGSRLNASESRNLGDLIHDLSSEIYVSRSRGLDIWLYTGNNSSDEWSLPAPGRVEEWDGGALFPVKLIDCRDVTWNLRLIPGVAGFLSEAELNGIELVVDGGLEASFSGLQYGKDPPGGTLPPDFYQLRFASRVRFGDWNISVHDGASAVVRNSILTRGAVEGRGSNLSIINCETREKAGSFEASLGGRCVISDSRLSAPVTALPGGDLRILNSSNSSRVTVKNGASLRLLDSYLLESPDIAVGGFTVGKAQPLPEAPSIEERSRIPVSIMTRADVGGIGTFFPKVSGLEFLEDRIVPYFELNLLNRIYVRFPEFEYVLVRRRWPLFSTIAVGVEALFERELFLLQEDGRVLPIQATPLSYETNLAGRIRLLGPVWGRAEIATDPSARSYSGLKSYLRLEAVRRIPEIDLEARAYTGIEYGSGGYRNSYYPIIDETSSGMRPVYVDYGLSVETIFDERWLFSAHGRIKDLAEEQLLRNGSGILLEWEIILALAYRFQ